MSNERQKELFAKKASHVAASYMRRVKAFPDTPSEMNMFFEQLNNIFIDMRDVSKKQGRKSIGTYCAMVPEELIYAAGALPVRLCSGSYTAYTIGDEYVPRDACPLVKSVVGFGKIGNMPLYDNCDMMVITITCDCKKKIAGLLKEIKPISVLQIPLHKEPDEATKLFSDQLYSLCESLEHITGNQITVKTLEAAIEKIGYAQYELSRFLNLKKSVPPLIYGSQAMAVLNAYAYMDAAVWAEALCKLNTELEKRQKKHYYVGREKNPRILVTGSPIVFPNFKIPLLIEEMGGILVADETCMGERGISDPVVINDGSFHGIIRALANRYIRPCTCPVFTDNSQRIYRLMQLVKENKIQGIVYHVLRGCLVYDFEYSLIEETFAKMDIPVIRVESDYNEEDVEQIRTRIEAFLEMIKLKEYKKQR